MALDLTGPRQRVSERVFVDRATLRRNKRTAGRVDIDDDTGLPMVDPDADAVVLATGVPCVAREANRLERTEGYSVTVKTWIVSFDYFLAPDLNEGDEIFFEVSEDDELQGSSVFVSRVITGTLRVSRQVEATRKVDGTSLH